MLVCAYVNITPFFKICQEKIIIKLLYMILFQSKNLFHHIFLGGPYDFVCLKLW